MAEVKNTTATLASQKEYIQKEVVTVEHDKTLRRVGLLTKIAQDANKPDMLRLEASRLALAIIDDYEKKHFKNYE